MLSIESNLKDLSQYVYYIDSKHDKHDPRIKKGWEIELKNIEYKILKTEDNTINGMQAMAVAPVGKDGKAVENRRRLDIIIPVNKSEKGSMS